MKKKKFYTATVTLALTAGVAAGVSSYKNGAQFQPVGSSSQIKENRVSFSDDGNTAEHKNSEKKDNSALWEKEESAAEKSAMNTAYLFEQMQKALNPVQNTVNIARNNPQDHIQMPEPADQKNESANSSEPAYDLTDDKEKADTVVKDQNRKQSTEEKNETPGNSGKDDNTKKPGTDGKKEDTTEKENNNEEKKPENVPGGSTDTKDTDHTPETEKKEYQNPQTPQKPDVPSDTRDTDPTTEKPDTKDDGKKDDGKKDDGKKDEETDRPAPKPSRPSASARDPKPEKPKPGVAEMFPSSSFEEDKVNSDTLDVTVRINMGSNMSGALYKGQQIDAYTAFCALDTYVYERKSDRIYLWSDADYGDENYIRVTGVSFDAGKSWKESFPVTIPKDVEEGEMYFKVEYRLARTGKNSEWVPVEIPYIPQGTRFYLLSQKVESENEEISTDNILNDNQFPEVGTTLNLMNYLSWYLGWDQLDALFPGWTENGELLPWKYEITAGRHILEPADRIPLDPMYDVRIRYQWFLPDGRVDADMSSMDSQYLPIQTLVGITADTEENGRKMVANLKIPKYMQAVCLEEEIETDTIQIPDTVLYIKNDGICLRVRKAYEVEKDNPNYMSEDGMLYNKEKTSLIGIPYEREELTIPETVEKVNLTDDNQIKTLRIEAGSIDNLPQMNSEKLKGCKVIVPDVMLDEVLMRYGEKLTNNENCVAAASDPDTTYTMKNGMAVKQDGELYRVLGYDGKSLRLPSYITSISAGAFQQASEIRTLIWPKEEEIQLNRDSFADSSIQEIICYSQEQLETLTAYLDELGMTDITIFLSGKTSDGFSYFSEGTDGEVITTLTDAPADIQEFDGTVENGTVTVNAIEANAFAGCENLKWVILPEETSVIGYQAFRDCTALEGVLIDNRDTITIGNKAFDGCNMLRFVASNAKKGVMEGDYEPNIYNQENYDGMTQISYFFVLQGAEGYGFLANSLPQVQGVDHYAICDLGAEGKALFAVDERGEAWLALRSGKVLDAQVQLPSGTSAIYRYAFSGSQGTEGSFQINWDEIQLSEIQEAAFYESQLSGDIRLGTKERNGAVSLGQASFARCEIESVEIYDTLSSLDTDVFVYNSSLKSVEICDALQSVIMRAGMFSGCMQLEKLILNASSPMDLIIFGSVKYQFNYEWTPEEEAQNLKLILPDNLETEYIMEWRYLFAGSTGSYSGDNYIDLWNDTQGDMIDWFTGTFPADEEVDAAARERLLQAENRIRSMIGCGLVSEPTEFYPYRLFGDNLTLLAVPTYLQDAVLSPEVVGLPAGWFLDQIAEGAFAGVSNLRSATIPANMSGMYSGMLKNAAENSSQVTLKFQGEQPLTLQGYTEEKPFEFGIAEDKIKIQVPDGCEKNYIQEWTYPMAGFADQSDMEAAVISRQTEEGEEVTEEKVQEEMVSLLLPAENRLRSMLGIEAAKDPEDLFCIAYEEEAELQSETEIDTETETETETGTEEESETENHTKAESDSNETEPETASEELATDNIPETETQTEQISSETESEAQEASSEHETEEIQMEQTETEASEKETETVVTQETEFEIVIPESQKEQEE